MLSPLSVSVLVVFVGVVAGQNPGHEKFWTQPDFFASLSDYLMSDSGQSQHQNRDGVSRHDSPQRYDSPQRHEFPQRHTANHHDTASSGSELFHTFAKPPPSVVATSQPHHSHQHQNNQGQGQGHNEDMIISQSELSRVMNFALDTPTSPSTPSQGQGQGQSHNDETYPNYREDFRDSYNPNNPYYGNYEQRPAPEQGPNVPGIQLMAPPEDGYLPQSQPEYQYKYHLEGQDPGQGQSEQGQNPPPPLVEMTNHKMASKPRPQSHPNALSISALEYKKTSTRRRRPLLPLQLVKNLLKHSAPSSTTITPSTSTSTSTTSRSMSTPRSTTPSSTTTISTSTHASTSTLTPRTSTPSRSTTPTAPTNQYRFLKQQIIPVAAPQPPRFQIITVPKPQTQGVQLIQQNQIPHRFQVVDTQPPPNPHFRIVTVPDQGHRQLSPNVEMLPAQQVYEGVGLGNGQFKLPAIAPTHPSYHHNHYHGGVQGKQTAPPKYSRPQIRLNPNILIATPATNQRSGEEAGQQYQTPPQSSNPFGPVEQDEKYVQKEAPGLVSKISNMLETGRRILYFPKGVVDVVDQAMTYAETNPYVNLVMGTLADTILGSTKGMTAAPPTNNKPPTLLIANPATKSGVVTSKIVR